MTSFDTTLRSFQQTLISYQDLLATTSLLVVKSPDKTQQIKLTLETEYRHGRIAEDVYHGLNLVLDNNKTRLIADNSETGNSSSSEAHSAQTVVSDGDSSLQRQSVTHSLPLNTESLLTGLNPNKAVAELKVGDTVKNRFVLDELLGMGGMGKVFKATDLRKVEAGDKDSSVAVKVLSEDFKFNPMALVALQRETKRTQILAHPNIIKVYDFDRDGDHVFMTMEYLEGRPLSELINDRKNIGFPFDKAWPIIRSIAEALAYAHKKNIVHSDLKPSNVYVCKDGDIRVLDFGIACAIGRSEKADDTTLFNARSLGALTLAYASLEQYRNDAPDPRDDIYALACITYEVLTGKHPFGRLSAEKALEVNLQVKPVSQLGRRQWRGLQKGLAFTQEKRSATIAEFVKNVGPRSPTYYFYRFGTIGLIGLLLANIYWRTEYQLNSEIYMKNLAELTPQQQQQIKDLLELAEIHLDVGYLTAPTGSNAFWAYQEILKIDPYNQAAIKGIEKIADMLEQQAIALNEKGNQREALEKVKEGLEINPSHKGLLALQDKYQLN